MEVSVKAIIAAIIFGLVVLIGGGVLISSCTHIEAGHVGVLVKRCGGGGVSPTPLSSGYHFAKPFCESIVEYPTNLRTLILADGDSDKANDGITVNSKEGLPITVDVSLSFTLDPSKVPALYQKYRVPIGEISTKFVRQTVREGLQSNFAQWTAEQIYSEKKEIVRAAAQQFLVDKLTPEGFQIQQFTLNDVRVPKQVTDAINARVAMVQEAQRADAEVKKTEAIARQREAQADGEAKALRTRADAEAYYNKTVAESLTPAFVQYQAQQRWDGKLPQFTGGGAVPFIEVPTGQK